MNEETYPRIPERFRDRVAAFPESSMCATRIKVDLTNGRKIYDVIIAGRGDIVKVGTKLIEKPEDLDFDPAEIVEVHCQK